MSLAIALAESICGKRANCTNWGQGFPVLPQRFSSPPQQCATLLLRLLLKPFRVTATWSIIALLLFLFSPSCRDLWAYECGDAQPEDEPP